MFGKLELIHMAQSLARHAGARQAEIARNIANADTPGYRAQDLQPFADSYGDDLLAPRHSRPRHFGAAQGAGEARPIHTADAAEPNGNSVSLETEMMRAAEVRQQHDMALAIYRSSADILRSSLERR
ncbi:MAG: flagellar basal body rod protein FlgB [Rhodobacteraceae bacterium GWE1_64_9]|nr:MAG: flagellar basal body rod protein FlgB [Rhodobacteraceae bacterium GWE1_64_9]OHC50935.1 MAG: flagellar basal body rod protein FlgB [Rhodobacteraceae bacterium GWF1_65_7]HBD90482.1 flagellar basal body rod protein FlgB [Gemmobacter sp.]HBU15352.1 flagellar basal body rod protein FlgB [Gemmobacter sp.]